MNQLRKYGYIEDSMVMEIDSHSHLRSLLANLTTVQDEFRVTVVSKYPTRIAFVTFTASLKTSVSASISAGFDFGDILKIKCADPTAALDHYLTGASHHLY